MSIRLALGGLLIASSVAKLTNMQLFADAVAGYGILPEALARLYAGVLPWAELFTGCSLVLGVFIIPAAALSILMSVSFVVANSYALFHDVGKACSCLGTLVNMSHPISLGVDLAMTVGAALLIVKSDRVNLLTLDTLVRNGSFGLKARTRALLQAALLGIVMIAIAASIRTEVGFVGTQIDQALQSDKTAVVFFWTGEASEPALYRKFQMLADLEYEYDGSICIIRVDYLEDPRASRQFSIKQSPTLLVITGTGSQNQLTIVGRLEGDFEKWQVEDLLNGQPST